MASRRRRAAAPKAAPPDLGTPETRARLQGPPWGDWPRELQEAAEAIDLAIRLLAGASMTQAQLLGRIRHMAAGEAAWEARLIRRYTWWRWEIVRRGWRPDVLIGWIALCEAPDLHRLREALTLYANAPRHVA